MAALLLRHPGFRTCAQCESWVFTKDGLWLDGAGQPCPRTNPEVPTPCGTCPRVPAHVRRQALHWKELRKHAVEPTREELRAWAFWRECRAVNDWPRGDDGRVDPVVRWYAAVFEAERERWEREQAAADRRELLELVLRKR